MTHWRANLSGDKSDLTMLAEALSGTDCEVSRRGEGFVLKSELFDPADSGDTVRRIAEEIAAVLSGASMALLGTTRRFEIGGLVRVDDDGRQHAYIFADSAVITMRAFPATIIVTHPDGSVETSRPADPLNQWMPLSIRNPKVAAALRIRARGPLDWDDVVRVLEVVQSAGIPVANFPNAPSSSRLERLSKTANSVHALGDYSRHPGRDYAPPAIPASLEEARTLVDQLLRAWLTYLSGQGDHAA